MHIALNMFSMSYLSLNVIIFSAFVAVKDIVSRWNSLLTIAVPAYSDFAAMRIYWAHFDRVGSTRGIQSLGSAK